MKKTRLSLPSDTTHASVGFPDADALAALRAWYAGVPARDAVVRYLHSTVA